MGAGGSGMAAGRSGSTNALEAIVSHAISMATGPGRPDSICRNASLTIAGRVCRPLDARRPFGQRAQGCELVGQLVQMPAAAAEERRGHLPRDAKHRRAAADTPCTAPPSY